jgi:hypothetical protein
MMRIDIKIKNCSVNDFVKVFENGPPIKIALEKRKVRDFSDTESLLYAKVKPAMMDPREHVVKRTVKRLEDGSTLHLM